MFVSWVFAPCVTTMAAVACMTVVTYSLLGLLLKLPFPVERLLMSSVQFSCGWYLMCSGKTPLTTAFIFSFLFLYGCSHSFLVWTALKLLFSWGRARDVFSSGLYLMCSGKTPLTTAYISASFLHAFSGVMALALYPQVLSQKL